MKINSYKPGVLSYLFPSIIIVVFVQDDTFVVKHRSLVAEINFNSKSSKKVVNIDNVYVDDFLTAQDCFQIFLSKRIIVCMQLFLLFGYLKQVSNRYHERISKVSSTVRAWSYDKSRGGISDISFKVDTTIFDWLYIDFTSVEACVELSYKAFDRRFSFGFWFLVFSRKEFFSHNGIFGRFNSFFNNLFQIGSIIGLKYLSNAIFSFIIPVFKILFANRIARFCNLVSCLFTIFLFSMLMYRGQLITLRYCKVIKSFSFRPSAI